MKPIRLTMSAFGSYAKKTTISFDELHEGLFLITGDTGSGKTMIFDAIMYSLYNDTSGMTRGSSKLRSDFAAVDVETFVEFEFVLRGETYTIRRSPAYERPKMRGKGLTECAAEVELTFPDGRVLTKIKTVDDTIPELLGLDKTQFRQVAMIAQGEFYELIGTSSNDRSAIFRKLFNTSLYEKMQLLISEKYKNAKSNRSMLEGMLFHQLGSIVLPEEETEARLRFAEIVSLRSFWSVAECITDLDRIDAEMVSSLNIVRREEEAADRRLGRAQISLEQLRKDNEKLLEFDKAVEERDQLKATERAFEQMKKRLEDDDRATRLVDPSWNALEGARSTLKETKENLQQAEENRHDAAVDLDKAASQLAKAKEYDRERGELPLEISKLEDELKILESLAPLQQAAETQNKVVEEAENSHEQFLTTRSELSDALQEKQDELDSLADVAHDLTMAKAHADDVRADHLKVSSLRQDADNLKKDVEGLLKQREQCEEKRQAWRETAEEAHEASDLLFRERAGYLALQLVEGEPCPVCGSKEHPHKATLSEDSLDEAAVERLEKEAQAKRQIADEASSALERDISKTRSTLDRVSFQADALTDKLPCLNRQEEIEATHDSELTGGALEFMTQKIVELQDSLQQLNEFLTSEQSDADQKQKALQAQSDRREELKRDITETSEAMRNLTEKIALKSREIQEGKLRATKLEGEISALTKRVSGASLGTVKTSLDQKKERQDLLEREYKQATENERQARETLTAAEATLKSIQLACDSAKKHYLAKENEFYEALEKGLFVSENDYREKRLKDDERIDLEQKVDEEKSKRDANVRDLDRLSREIKGLSKRDEAEEVAVVDALQKQLSALKEAHLEQSGRVAKYQDILESIKSMHKKTLEALEEEKMLSDIADLATGNHKEADKISFEVFIQTWYFTQVINRANQRFARMTNGRYELIRSEKGKDGRSRTGLDLSVEDLWTAKTRPVSTLSGGEKFQAALSMALGLSDVVSEHAGGVEIDALFIDEGFGGLDEESLQDAIHVLQDLSVDNRLIGVISHVPMLKQAINQQLQVRIDSEGSVASWVN